MIPTKNKVYLSANTANGNFKKNINQMLNFKELENQLHEADEVLNDLKKLKLEKEKNRKVNEKLKAKTDLNMKDNNEKDIVPNSFLEKGKIEKVNLINNSTVSKRLNDFENKNSNFTKTAQQNSKSPDFDVFDYKKKISETIEPFENELKKLLNINSFGNNLILKLNKTEELITDEKNEKVPTNSDINEQKEKKLETFDDKNEKNSGKEKISNQNEYENQEYEKPNEKLRQEQIPNQEMQRLTLRKEDFNIKTENKNSESIENTSNISAIPNVSHNVNRKNHYVEKEKKDFHDLQKPAKRDIKSDELSLLEKKTAHGTNRSKYTISQNFDKTSGYSMNMMDSKIKFPDGPIDLGFMSLMI